MRRFGWMNLAILAVIPFFWGESTSSAGQYWLKDGRILEGKHFPVSGLAEGPKAPDPTGAGPLQLILAIDDGLRRTFLSKRQIERYLQADSSEILEKYRIRQRVLQMGKTVKSVGPLMRVQPFDEFGRRIITMNTNRGPTDVIQCITEITPVWTKVEGHTHVWEMRMATSSIPPDVLAAILARQTKATDVESRRKLARFYLQSQRYQTASRELEQILADFPNNDAVGEQLAPSIRRLKQLTAQRVLEELKLRQEAGQHRLVAKLLGSFPSEGAAGNILEAVRAMLHEYETLSAQRSSLLEQLDAFAAQIDDAELRQRVEPVRLEMRAELNGNTIGRLASFRQLADDDGLLPAEKVSLAISGWLLGSESATVNLPVALSVFEVRQLVRQYLNAGDTLTRSEIFERFHSEEGARPELVAKLLSHMKPPTETPPQHLAEADDPQPAGEADPTKTAERAKQAKPGGTSEGPESEAAAPPNAARPGYFELEVAGVSNAPPVRYLVQLPPEYDPYRRYPTIVTLHGAGNTPDLQIDWWAGAWTEAGWRSGQASRHGYVVIAPAWAADHQREYRYSAEELAAVLYTLRDACRRFAVDTDRVFLSGHSMGGDAAWDIGLAHPDLWAGVIPVVARSDKFCALYWQNAKLLPFYFVGGELDGDKLVRNARDFDRYLKRGYNVTVVEFLGRGHEDFSDEIQRIFDWMGRLRREFYPREFTVSTMRPWDNFFWWIELANLPHKSMVNPVDWPPPRGTQPVETKATITANNGLFVRTGSGLVRVWISPEMLDLDQRVNVVINGQRVGSGSNRFEPDLETLLEDVRTRGDRQHPFWITVETGTGRAGTRR